VTTREIAGSVGKTERSIQTWARKTGEKIASVGEKIASAGHGKAADFDINETIAIIETGMGKNAADLFRMSAKEKATENQEVPTDRLDRLELLMDKMLVAMGNMMLMQQPVQTKTQERATLPAPALDPRSHIIKLANEYVSKTGIEHRDAYTMLYREFGYRTHCNAILSAKNRGMKIIDYIDSEGQIETLEAIALEEFAS